MDVGIVASLPDTGVPIIDLARQVEEAEFESLFVTEHTHVPATRRDLLEDDFHRHDPHLVDQFTALGAAAAITSKLRLGTGMCIVPQRDPIILAKQVASLDHLSKGRFLFGAAAGWLLGELRNHGIEPSTRWERMDEQLLAMKCIWTAEEAEFHGTFVHFDPIWSWPKPVQKPYPPILIGGTGPRSLGLVAAHADAWAPVVESPDEFATAYAAFTTVCNEVDRSVPPVTVFTAAGDERTLGWYADQGVARCAVLAPPTDAESLGRFLEPLAGIKNRFLAAR